MNTCPPHYFLVPEPAITYEPLAVCKKCGIERLMSNSVEITHWRSGSDKKPKPITVSIFRKEQK